MGMLFDEMSKSGGKNALFPKSAGSEMYEGWFRKEVASQFASTGGVGLGDVIARQLEERNGLATTAQPLGASGGSSRQSRGRVSRGGRVKTQAMVASGGRPNRRQRVVSHDHRRPPPVRGALTSGFGQRSHPVTGAIDQHRGIDLAARVGTAVEVPYSGRVLAVGEDPRLGIHVTVEHVGGWRSLYAHLSSVEVRPGDTVGVRDVIARTGASGRVTGPHLHFALYRHGKAVDPTRWIRVRQETDVARENDSPPSRFRPGGR